MKIRVVMIFIIVQAALAQQHTSRRSTNIAVEDRAIRCNRNVVTNTLSNMLLSSTNQWWLRHFFVSNSHNSDEPVRTLTTSARNIQCWFSSLFCGISPRVANWTELSSTHLNSNKFSLMQVVSNTISQWLTLYLMDCNHLLLPKGNLDGKRVLDNEKLYVTRWKSNHHRHRRPTGKLRGACRGRDQRPLPAQCGFALLGILSKQRQFPRTFWRWAFAII